MRVGRSITVLAVWMFGVALAAAQPSAPAFEDHFADGAKAWRSYFEEGRWTTVADRLQSGGESPLSARLAPIEPLADAVVEVQVRLGESLRHNFGIVLRAQKDRSCAILRHYDRQQNLELIRYERGSLTRIPGEGRVDVQPGSWYVLKAAAIEEMLLAKIWPVGEREPEWQFRGMDLDRRAGGLGVIAEDATRVEFRQFRVWSAAAVEQLKEQLAEERRRYLEEFRANMALQLEPTPLVLRTAEGPKRRVNLRLAVKDRSEPVGGSVNVTLGSWSRTLSITRGDFKNGVYPLLVPEPETPTELQVTFDTDIERRLEHHCTVQPARHWKIYITPHTHYDIGFTHPQPEVIERLSRDMDLAVEYCGQTADWPPESRFRWVVEVSGLMKNYIERHMPEQVDRLMELVRQGRIEICGYYLNMPTEITGHEEIIRCLYYSESLRREYGVPIDTAMINDVPGYAWSLPQLLSEFGINRVSFRANSIRGNFLWYRQGAVPRPFYWEGPEGSRVFMWYTDTYRDGNFFREPGLHEESFLSVIRRNEATGYPFDHIQLRMGGDNLPPDLDASKNARAWNEKYLWPKVLFATNREFLEPLEEACGQECTTHRGDIPSWWADGPASAAQENGDIRLLHDQLVATELLWTTATLADPHLEYPRARIDEAYDKMIHFDEHTWGASSSISQPQGEETIRQWKWKSAYAKDAARLAGALRDEVVTELSRQIPAPTEHAVAVWNTLGWKRSDVVELRLVESPFEDAESIAVSDTRDGKTVPVQMSSDGKRAYFLARDLPPAGHVVYSVCAVQPEEKVPADTNGEQPTLENDFYRITAVPESGGWSSWYDKRLRRELLDTKAAHLGNQPIYERSLDGREAISRKQPTRFERSLPQAGRLVSRTAGVVFDEMVLETSLPTMPTIRQRVRLYHDLKMVAIENNVSKQEVYDPEGVYFAFPLAAKSPETWFEIAGAAMRPGKDQLTYSCQDFYAIQHWSSVVSEGCEVVVAPLEAPLMLAGGLNAYQWADAIRFDNGHLFSWVMNNYWTTNFRAGQGGEMRFRYRLASFTGEHDAVRCTHFAWQPFHPPLPVWLAPGHPSPGSLPTSLIDLEGETVVITCIKRAEADDSLIFRLLEVGGRPARCALRLPPGLKVTQAFRADCVERRQTPLEVVNGRVPLTLRANEIATVGLELGADVPDS